MKFSRKIALRYLWSKRSEAFITIITIISVIGVALGVMVLNVVMAVMSGFEIELREKIIGANSHIVVKKLGGSIRNYKNLIKEIKQVDGVKSVSAFTYNQAMLRTKKSAAGVLVRGIEPESAAARQLLNYLPENSDIVSLLSPIPLPEDNKIELPPLVVGRELARAMFLVPGKAVSLLSPQVESSPFGLIPKFRRFIVSGTYSSGLVEYENTLVYTSLEAAQRFFKMEGAVSGLEVLVNDVEKAPIVSRAIMDKISGLQVGLYAQDWTETNKPLWDAIKLEKKAYFIILLLIVVMASFSIVSTLVMIVLEKRRDIAVLMTMGANSRNIADIFKFQGAIIGAIGTVLGLLFGFFGCLALKEYGFPLDERIFQMTTLPVYIDLTNFLLVGVSAFVICYAATIYPSYRASRLEPSEVLRYE